MVLDHIDRPPLGDINETLQIVIATNPGVIFDITYTVDGETENFSTRDDSQGNGGVPRNAAYKTPPGVARPDVKREVKKWQKTR